MKTIEPIQIWDNGKIKNASILNAYVTNLNLNQNAYFTYVLYEINNDSNLNQIVSGQLFMNNEIYSTWHQDQIAWDFVANSLNLVITGDYTPPQIIEQPVENNPESL